MCQGKLLKLGNEGSDVEEQRVSYNELDQAKVGRTEPIQFSSSHLSGAPISYLVSRHSSNGYRIAGMFCEMALQRLD